MSKNQKQIEKILSLNLDLDKFYAIRIYEREICLQGNCTSSLKREFEELGFEFILDGSYITAKKDGFDITLTF